MQKLMLLGDEAIAQAAIDAGVSGIYSYPGTPSTEITEFVISSKEAKEKGIVATWCSNEKTALECAIGMSYAGKKAMSCMKHVGLNVAADPFMNSAITGANGGLIILVADDPSMHSSQNEQDSRFFGRFAMLPILEPSNQQEAYDMVLYGFSLSEQLQTPILMRITTRLAHSRAAVVRRETIKQNELSLPKNAKQFILLPAIARKQYKILLEKQSTFEEESIKSGFNKYIDGQNKELGIIACGLGYNYLLENYPNRIVPYPIVKIAQYPLPIELIQKLVSETQSVLVLEDGYPIVEEQLKGLLSIGIKVRGRLDGSIPRDGELNPNIVGKALGMPIDEIREIPNIVVGRPPSLCPGCPHIDSYLGLNEAIKQYGNGRIFSDIGCYTLGALPPYNAINTCVEMGASITMAKGATDAGFVPAVAVIGDSTFTHSGMTGLLDAVVAKSPITIMILDNATAGMTGGQPSYGSGRIAEICKGLGVEEEHIHIIKPLRKNHAENTEIISRELAYNGVSVIIPTRECIQTLNRRMRLKFKNKK